MNESGNTSAGKVGMDEKRTLSKYGIGQVVRHRVYPFRGVIYDVDPTFQSTEEWWNSIPEDVRPRKDQPFYHLFAENAHSYYMAYVSEQNLELDDTGEPVDHPDLGTVFDRRADGHYELHPSRVN